MNDNEMLIPPSMEEALFPYDKRIANEDEAKSYSRHSQSSTYSKEPELPGYSNTKSYFNQGSHGVTWSNSSSSEVYNNGDSRYEYKGNQNVNLKELDNVDTKSLPNNLFEMKCKKLEEEKKSHGYGNTESSRFASISSDPNFKETMSYTAPTEEPGMIGTFSNIVSEAYSRSKDIVWTAKEKLNEYEVADKLKYTGEKTLGVIKYTGSTISSIAQSDTTKSIVSKTAENVGYLFNRLWYGKTPENQEDQNKNSSVSSDTYGKDTLIGEKEDSFGGKRSLSQYSPPKNDLSGNVLFSKQTSKFSNRSYMS